MQSGTLSVKSNSKFQINSKIVKSGIQIPLKLHNGGGARYEARLIGFLKLGFSNIMRRKKSWNWVVEHVYKAI